MKHALSMIRALTQFSFVDSVQQIKFSSSTIRADTVCVCVFAFVNVFVCELLYVSEILFIAGFSYGYIFNIEISLNQLILMKYRVSLATFGRVFLSSGILYCVSGCFYVTCDT